MAAGSLYAVPAYRGWQTKTLEDGTSIEVRQVGDEFFHYWETKDGQQVIKNDKGLWQLAEQPAEMSESARMKRASRAYNQTQDRPNKVGKINLAPRGLVILVNYTDVSFYSGNTRQAMDNLMNAASYTYNGATGSTREYYRAQSNGQYVPDFDVVGPYTLSHKRAYYGGNNEKGEDLLAGDMIMEACLLADADGVDFTLYNNDGDQYVDFVYVIYAGAGEADSDVKEAVWPHNWTLSSAYYYNNCTYAKSDRKVDGLYIENYACSGELLYGQEGTRCGIGTIAHEFGHVLGLPDYYVTDKSASNYKKNYTPGAWSIMDYGSYNNDGNTPPNYSTFDKYFFGWLTPELLAKDAKQNISLTTDYTSAYQITGDKSLKACRTESSIWYVENRQKSGWDAYLPGHGMLVWEVTYNSSDWEGNCPNNENVGYTIVTANNQTRPYKPYTTKSADNSGTTFPGTNNIRSCTPATGCAMSDITESAGVITFKYNGGEVNYWTYDFDATHCSVPASGHVDKGAALNLTITPDVGYSLTDAECWAVEMGDDILEYGTGFTYNENNHTFSIASVTGDVFIIAAAKEVPITITWMDKGHEFTTTTTSAGKLVLPTEAPEACEGKVFVGWCATENYSSEDTAPTFVEDGDEAAEVVYYAVFATEDGEGSQTETYGFESTDDATNWDIDDEIEKSSSMKASGSYSGQINTNHTYIKYKNKVSVTNFSFKFARSSTNTNYNVYIETSTDDSNWTTAETYSMNSFSNGSFTSKSKNFDGKTALYVRFHCYNTTAVRYVDDISISYSGASYSDYTTTCVPPTKYAITVEEATHGSLVAKPSDEAAAGKTVTVTATPDTHYHLATLTVKDAEDGDVAVSGEDNVRTFTMPASAVTISATFAEDDQYTVRFFNNGEVISSNNYYAGETAEKPADPTADCDEYTFVGWWTAELADDNTEAKTWVNDFTVSGAQDYYAIYSKTVEGEGETEVAAVTFKTANSDGTSEITGSSSIKSTLVKDATGISSYSGSKLYEGVSGVKMGSSKSSGSITLTLSETVSVVQVVVNASQYSSDTGEVEVEAGSTSLGSKAPASNLTFSAEDPIETNEITVSTTSKRAYIASISIMAGGGNTTYYSSSVICTPSAIDEPTADVNAKAVKVLRDGQLYLMYKSTMYDVQGRRVK